MNSAAMRKAAKEARRAEIEGAREVRIARVVHFYHSFPL